MDDIVKQALVKWPNVPHCYGWLGLDTRGNWYMRDDASQAAGAFTSDVPGAKGSLLQHEKLIEFIQRNYASDALGQWFFQNGPQRVYIELGATPWIWRVGDNLHVTAHSGQPTHNIYAVVDELGWLYLHTDLGFGLVHTQDVINAARAIESGLWQVNEESRSSLEARYGYVQSPNEVHRRKARENPVILKQRYRFT